MTDRPVRVRFAPSPTGPLHIGGIRTALFNYAFAKKHNGTFIVRIEDTDQTRYVAEAEKYIFDSLRWSGLLADESPEVGGNYAPYRQSERSAHYQKYAQQLLDEGKAYYAFDTPEELEAMREQFKTDKQPSPQYNAIVRNKMRNSLTLPPNQVSQLLKENTPYVVRIKMPVQEVIRLNDMVRGPVKVLANTLDDKVLLKSDGLPTYHLANVVDDYLMEITHVIRGEEWLPSAPLHVLLYQYLGWEDKMPDFAHLPLLLKPNGQGKLSKRDGEKMGFPVFPIQWQDSESSQPSAGYREQGFLPEAFTNFLALLGWNPGTEQEIFSMDELIEAFSIEKVGKSGTKFDYEKAKWFNQQYIKGLPADTLANYLLDRLKTEDIVCSPEKAIKIGEQMKERIVFPQEIFENAMYFFIPPTSYDDKIVRKKWNDEAVCAFSAFAQRIKTIPNDQFTAETAKQVLNDTLDELEIKPGKVMQALRLALTGQAGGPDLMALMEIIGKDEVSFRLAKAIEVLPVGK